MDIFLFGVADLNVTPERQDPMWQSHY